MNRFESLLLGIAAGALVVAVVGPVKVVVLSLAVAAGSYVWRKVVVPRFS